MWSLLLCAAVCNVCADIPRRLFQTLPPSDVVSEDWNRWTKLLADTNPGFEILLFEDGAALAFVDEHYGGTELPHVYRYFVNKRVVMATDLFHLAVVGAIGGFCLCRCLFFRD